MPSSPTRLPDLGPSATTTAPCGTNTTAGSTRDGDLAARETAGPETAVAELDLHLEGAGCASTVGGMRATLPYSGSGTSAWNSIGLRSTCGDAR